ncbi:MAG: septation protein IspZ [Candidatus Pacebacteria bacterium]|jgi:intracellular septation protein|nr:septation protein IspZ [Candidatus Paceibacterota bacterium]
MFKKFYLGLLVEFGPIIVFLIVSTFQSFNNSVLIFVLATVVALFVNYILNKRLAWFPVIVALTIIIFGLLSYFLDNPFFIIFKDTLYNLIFGLALLIGLYYKKNILKPLFEMLFSMSDRGWNILAFRWACIFIGLAVSNEIARMILTPDHWVVYKGVTTLITTVFSLYQFTLAKTHRLPGSSPWGVKIT